MEEEGQLGETYSGLEDTLVTPISIRGLLDFGLGGLRVDNTVLPGNLLAVSLFVGSFLAAVLFQLLLETGLELTGLAVFHVVASGSCGIRLEEFDLVLDRSVQDLGLRNNGFKSGRCGAVWTRDGTLMGSCDLANLAGKSANICLDTLDTGKEILAGEDRRACLVHRRRVAMRRTGLCIGALRDGVVVARGGCGAVIRLLGCARVV